MVGLSKRSLPEPNLCMAVVTFSLWMKFYSVNIQIKAFHQFSPLLPFVFQYFVTMTFVIFLDFCFGYPWKRNVSCVDVTRHTKVTRTKGNVLCILIRSDIGLTLETPTFAYQRSRSEILYACTVPILKA